MKFLSEAFDFMFAPAGTFDLDSSLLAVPGDPEAVHGGPATCDAGGSSNARSVADVRASIRGDSEWRRGQYLSLGRGWPDIQGDSEPA